MTTGQPGRSPAFPDHFSRDPAAYSRFRPRYPGELFRWIAALPDRRRRAWDCGTGSGQAATPLAEHFALVVGSDGSMGQLRSAERVPHVAYCGAVGEAAPIRSGTIDLVTVAQALHWLDVPRFLTEVGRVLAPGGALAVWSYGIVEVESPIGETVLRFYSETVGPCWPMERKLVEEGYRSTALPIDEVATPPFAMEAALTLEELLGYIRTWSAVGRYLRAHGTDPVEALAAELGPLWGDRARARLVRWPLVVRAGRWRG
ncbi:MAG: class I SAM-dependent methyltransferase [Gemmatimonadales bacterium]